MRALAALVLLLLAPPAVAQDCGSESTQTDMNICFGKVYESADAKLNSLYKQMNTRLGDDAATKQLLVAAQRAWIAWRDAECAFTAAGVTGGSVYPTILASCLTDLTTDRAADFSGFLACEEGDLSCPLPPG